MHDANLIKDNYKFHENTRKSLVNYKTYMLIICVRDFL